MSIIKMVNLEFSNQQEIKMADHKPTVPTGHSDGLVTEQLPPTKSGFVGYKTTYSEKQKEAKYETPKAP